jgi:hypothetical protein
MKNRITSLTAGLAAAALLLPRLASASSHMDAPLINLDPPANTTDVYAFVGAGEGSDTNDYLVVGLGVYPFEEPGIGPNAYNFDPNVLYQIHICTTNKAKALGKNALNDLQAGRATISYQFQFNTTYADKNTILVSYLGVISNIDDASQNIRQTYGVTKIDHTKNNKATVIVPAGKGLVPPNNEGKATPFYNQGNDGDNPAYPGVEDPSLLDLYTKQAIYNNGNGYLAFAGQRDDGFYADVLGVFDLLQLRPHGEAKDSQSGYNIHEMVLRIPMSEIGGNMQTVGVYATTSRRSISVLRNAAAYTGPQLVRLDDKDTSPFADGKATVTEGGWVQVGRQGNPLFNEVLVAVEDKDLYNRSSPTIDSVVFAKYALNPEPAALFKLIYGLTNYPAIESNRTDIASIFIPDLIKVDLSTGPARLQGAGDNDTNYSSLGVFGGDTLTSKLTGGAVSGGWPNGRRWGDNVVDVALNALLDSTNLAAAGFGLIGAPSFSSGITTNDAVYSKVFPYESTPQNGRNHTHNN